MPAGSAGLPGDRRRACAPRAREGARDRASAGLASGSSRTPADTTDAKRGQLPDLELRHRRARCQDRIRYAKGTGLRNLPLRPTADN
jgi:hypothetical protein